MKRFTIFVLALALGCSKEPQPAPQQVQVKIPGNYPVFTIAPSEYPSWSTFMVATKTGLLNGEKGGKPGTLENKWGVDVVVKPNDYDTCITMYGGGAVDAVCITNMDVLNPSLGRASTAICPTSTSAGADACLAVGIENIDGLKGTKVYGLSKSVSEYLFVRCLTKEGKDPKDFEFVHLDPGPAATALQTGSEVKSVVVWNPFVLQTLRTNKNAKVLFDSTKIPGEIIDCVVVGNDSLKKEKGEEFAACICDTFYEINRMLADPKTADKTLAAIGEDFSSLPLEDMKLIVQQTKFYKTPSDGIELFKSKEFAGTMQTVLTTCKTIGVLEDKTPTIGFNDPNQNLNFDTKYMEKMKKR